MHENHWHDETATDLPLIPKAFILYNYQLVEGMICSDISRGLVIARGREPECYNQAKGNVTAFHTLHQLIIILSH
jgi:hypothetical protein